MYINSNFHKYPMAKKRLGHNTHLQKIRYYLLYLIIMLI
jgi:hypothetical protein